jgi:hypothetical protein
MSVHNVFLMALALGSVVLVAGEVTIITDKKNITLGFKHHAPSPKTSVKQSDHENSKGEGHETPALSKDMEKYIEELATNATTYMKHLIDIGVMKESIKNRLTGQALAQKTPEREVQNDAATCPPPGFDSVKPFSLAAYINGDNFPHCVIFASVKKRYSAKYFVPLKCVPS